MPCPICDKPTVKAYRPFCSRRCADVDLGRWMTGAYRVSTEEEGEEATEGDAENRGPLN
jgi:uncharacterized protein